MAPSVAATNFQPTDVLIEQTLSRLGETEWHGLERLVAAVYEERSRKGLPGFSLTRRIDGYWDNQGTEIDMIAVDDRNQRIRFGTCKRSVDKLESSLAVTDGHIQRFLRRRPHKGYAIEKVAIALQVDARRAKRIRSQGWLVEDLRSLTNDLV